MHITSAEFIKGVAGTDDILENDASHIALIGRSNVGKSSIINSLTRQRKLARTSAVPGRTREINVFLINRSLYLLDLPGYGFVGAPHEVKEKVSKLIHWYLFVSPYTQKKVMMIIDAHVGLKASDIDMLNALQDHGKRIVIVANKIDKIKKSQYKSRLKELLDAVAPNQVIPYSAEKNIGIGELTNELFAP